MCDNPADGHSGERMSLRKQLHKLDQGLHTSKEAEQGRVGAAHSGMADIEPPQVAPEHTAACPPHPVRGACSQTAGATPCVRSYYCIWGGSEHNMGQGRGRCA